MCDATTASLESVSVSATGQATVASTGPSTIGQIFRQYGPAYRDKYADRMSCEQLQVMLVMKLTAEQFIHRFLQHVLPRGFQKVRHFGFAHPRHRMDWEWLKMLVTVTLSWVYVLFAAAKALPIPYRPACPHCGGPLSYVGMISERDWPFAAYDTS